MQPLAGIKVLDFSTLLPGPLATLILSESGAEVTKVEKPGGEEMRSYAPRFGRESALFGLLNRGKKSLVADLTKAADVSRVLELARCADVLVEQFRPGVMDRLGLGHEKLRALNPRLVYCSITGYGQDGPNRDRAGHDINYLADAGLLSLSFGTAQAPVVPPALIADIGGGSYPAVMNILLALRAREASGNGSHLDIAMTENLFTFMPLALAEGFAAGHWLGNGEGRLMGKSPRYNLYATADGKMLAVGALEQKFWAGFCEAIGLEAKWREDGPDPEGTLRRVREIIAAHPSQQWRKIFDAQDCCCTLLGDLRDCVEAPHFVERRIFDYRLENEAGETIPALPVPVVGDFRDRKGAARVAPALAEREIGVSQVTAGEWPLLGGREPSDEAILLDLFKAALAAARPDGQFEGRLPAPPKGRTIVIGAGKAAASMARAFENAWPHPCEGLVVTRYGHGAPTRHVEVVEAAHPVPDAAGERAAARILALARSAKPDDLVICLMSGGASALLTLPASGITLEEKRALNLALLQSGAPIDEMNTVRKALSAIKGGRLAAAARSARLVTYLISDVPGDDPSIIGSGPTVPGGAQPDAALAILKRYGIEISPKLERAILANSAPNESFPGHEIVMLATPKMALDAAAAVARRHGVTPLILGDAIEGEARAVATVMAGLAESVVRHGEPARKPCVLLSGGETTVTVKPASGTSNTNSEKATYGPRGGRNTEFLLALALRLGGLEGVSAIACDTDGIDGTQDNAGAWIDAGVLAQSKQKGIDAGEHLARHDSYGFFAELERLVVSGPTLTNVNDFRAILIR
ncbi:MAG: CoA transferase [Hyphomicrobiales bacterium]|nr:CoA transferase [Hyphomicrobiales bacterium]